MALRKGLLNWIIELSIFQEPRQRADIAFERDGSNTGAPMRKISPC